MKKISLIATLISAVLLLQNCKKDVAIGTTTSTEPMIAIINDTTWIAKDTVSASIVYNAATQTKVLTCQGTSNNKQINLLVTQHSALNTTGFPLTTFNINATTDNEMSYWVPQRNSQGVVVLAPLGSTSPGGGTLTVTTIDSVKKIISGTFSFSTILNHYDSNGNITSITSSQIQAGGFNNIPYTLTSN
ncbi:hypothetical protein JN11_03483 [Mucilaginibacter frigoritolerans]|uniref:Uncharacterized protein n=1 Tax=Mucilaginibacter frigoritolerans TaxID=652788 RepID=A0A562TXR5_9SPHI|nr:DUF6252 family protein [Mucilaginibacter frigoritolerans]TWI97660.1 hypothetical protein JN11_03483 [Mucilaginibacter frigoritolerans]